MDGIIGELEAAGVVLLINSNRQLPTPFQDVWICGLDDAHFGQPEAEKTFEAACGIRLVMMQSPSGLPQLLEHSFFLTLCGHTHGGQIALPNGWPL